MTITADRSDLAALQLFGTALDSVPEDPRLRWRIVARPDQLLPPLADPWRVLLLRGGRGSGKTRAGAQALAEIVLQDTDGEGEYGIIAPTYADAWTKCVEGESGILRALGTSMSEVKDHKSKIVKSALRTYGEVVLFNGIVIYIDSANEGGFRIQGRNLKSAWCDEIGLWTKWEIAWGESLKFAVRHGWSKIIATGTPKASQPARKLVRSLLRDEPEHGGVISRRLRTIDNVANLSDAFYRTVIGASKGTRLERQELEGELLDDVANALWSRDLVESVQVPYLGEKGGPPFITRCYIGVDPSDGKEDSDEQAYTVVARGLVDDPHVYVLENWGGQESPVVFAKRVIRKAQELDATLIIEKNHGGEWLKATFEQAMKETGHVRYEVVHASQAKRTRAEPVAAMYERGIVKHCVKKVETADGHQDEERYIDLEDQMCSFTGAQGERSPDRLDSLVWACHPYLSMSFGPPVPGGVRRYLRDDEFDLGPDGAGRMDDPLAKEKTRARQKLSEAHGGAYDDKTVWDLDSFAPAEAPEERPAGPKGNVKSWR